MCCVFIFVLLLYVVMMSDGMVIDMYRLLLFVNFEYIIVVDDLDMFVIFCFVVINIVVILFGECRFVLFILDKKDFMLVIWLW